MMRRYLVQVASSGRDAAHKIIESDLEQTAMILTTLVAGTTYGWIEGYGLVVAPYGSEQWLATQNLWFLGHFSTYSVAMGILFACITGGFSLIKGRNMFKHGKRYFLITFAGNYPFAWLVEDFSFFWFYPAARLNDTAWTSWLFGGAWLLDPWRSGVKIWIPSWYWIVLVFWTCMMWYAHRCTVYDNLVKDEIARQILPDTIKIPQVEAKKPVRVPEEVAERPSAPAAEEAPTPKAESVTVEPEPSPREVPQAPTSAPKPEQPSPQQPTLEPRRRSPEAEEALEKLREKWLRNANNAR